MLPHQLRHALVWHQWVAGLQAVEQSEIGVLTEQHAGSFGDAAFMGYLYAGNPEF